MKHKLSIKYLNYINNNAKLTTTTICKLGISLNKAIFNAKPADGPFPSTKLKEKFKI